MSYPLAPYLLPPKPLYNTFVRRPITTFRSLNIGVLPKSLRTKGLHRSNNPEERGPYSLPIHLHYLTLWRVNSWILFKGWVATLFIKVHLYKDGRHYPKDIPNLTNERKRRNDLFRIGRRIGPCRTTDHRQGRTCHPSRRRNTSVRHWGDHVKPREDWDGHNSEEELTGGSPVKLDHTIP